MSLRKRFGEEIDSLVVKPRLWRSSLRTSSLWTSVAPCSRGSMEIAATSLKMSPLFGIEKEMKTRLYEDFIHCKKRL